MTTRRYITILLFYFSIQFSLVLAGEESSDRFDVGQRDGQAKGDRRPGDAGSLQGQI